MEKRRESSEKDERIKKREARVRDEMVRARRGGRREK